MPIRGQRDIDSRTVLIGFRQGDQASIYCGEDPVFQFNGDGQLRRAYFDGCKFAAHEGRLTQLIRNRETTEIHLERQPISPDFQELIAERWGHWRSRIVPEITSEWTVMGTDLPDFQKRINVLMNRLPVITIAQSPNV